MGDATGRPRFSCLIARSMLKRQRENAHATVDLFLRDLYPHHT